MDHHNYHHTDRTVQGSALETKNLQIHLNMYHHHHLGYFGILLLLHTLPEVDGEARVQVEAQVR